MAAFRVLPVPLDDPAFRSLGVEVWRIDLDVSREPSDEAVADLDDGERARLARFLQVGDRARFACIRSALRRRLGGLLDLPARDVPLRVDASGKPRLPDDRLWFNVAHSGAHGLLALSWEASVGVDIEQARDFDRLDALADLVLSEAERPIWFGEREESRRALFLRIWTAKEAVLKAVGTGLGTDLKAFGVLAPDHSLAVRGHSPELEFEPATLHLAALPAPDGYAAALAVLKPDAGA